MVGEVRSSGSSICGRVVFYDYTCDVAQAQYAREAGFEVMRASEESGVVELVKDARVAVCHISNHWWEKLCAESPTGAVRVRVSATGNLPTFATERSGVVEINLLRRLGTMQAIDWEVIFATLISPEQVRGVVANDPALDPLIRQYFRPLRRDVSNALVILCQGYLAAWLATLVGRSLSREDRFASLAEMVKKSVVFANLDFSMVHEPQKRYEEAKRPDWWNVFQRRGLADFERLKRELRVEQGQPAERSAIFVGWPECHNRRDADRWPLCAAEEILDRIEGGQVIDDTALVWHTLLELLPASKGESPRTPTIG